MQELIQNIELLLSNHNFIVVPGFGGFVADKSGAIDIDGTLYPPHKSVGFNQSLTYNDGLLAQQYVKEHGIDFEQANARIDMAVNQLYTSLTTWKHLRFGSIGMFHLTENGLIFEPSAGAVNISSSFGLIPVFFPKIDLMECMAEKQPAVIESRVIHTESSDEKIEHKSVSFYWSSRWVAAAVAVIALLIMFPLTVNDSKLCSGTDRASIVPAVEKLASAVSTEKDSATTEQTTDSLNINYNIIIGSFYTQKKAERFIAELPARYRGDCKIISSEDRFRVSYRTFTNKIESDNFLETISDNPRFRDAWILETEANDSNITTL